MKKKRGGQISDTDQLLRKKDIRINLSEELLSRPRAENYKEPTLGDLGEKYPKLQEKLM